MDARFCERVIRSASGGGIGRAGLYVVILNLLPQYRRRFLNIRSGAGNLPGDVVRHGLDNDGHVFLEGPSCFCNSGRQFWKLCQILQRRDLHLQQYAQGRLPPPEVVTNFEFSFARRTELEDHSVGLRFNHIESAIDLIT